jgi:hypothetical protein
MDKLTQYRTYIQTILEKLASYKSLRPEIETQVVCDTAHDHYQLVQVGWLDQKRREYGCTLHVDIKEGKFWIQQDNTDIGIANELVGLGVPKTDIVLAFHPPYKRPFTEFAVA